MLQEQSPNIFGFSNISVNPSGFEKTAKFFNPSDNAQESSFSTQTTNVTRENSSYDTLDKMWTKGNMKKKCYNGKRILSAHINNSKRDCENVQIPSPPLISLKSAPPVDQIQHEPRQRPLIRNCLSQESIRRRIDMPQEGLQMGNNRNNFVLERKPINKKIASFFQNNCQNYNSDSELIAEKENFQGTLDAASVKSFRIRTQPNSGKVKIEKFNKIKVISAIPEPDTNDNLQNLTPSFIKRGFSDKKPLRIDTKKASLEIQVDDPKIILHQYPQSSYVKSSNMFIFPNSATAKAKGFSPLAPLNIEITNRSNTPSSANLRKAPMLLNKFDDYEPLKGLMELRSPTALEQGSLVLKKFNSESASHLNTLRNMEIGGAGSPVVRVRPNMCFKKSAFASESGVLSPTGQLGVGIKVQRVNSKFKNEQAVLNKLFNPARNLNTKE